MLPLAHVHMPLNLRTASRLALPPVCAMLYMVRCRECGCGLLWERQTTAAAAGTCGCAVAGHAWLRNCRAWLAQHLPGLCAGWLGPECWLVGPQVAMNLLRAAHVAMATVCQRTMVCFFWSVLGGLLSDWLLLWLRQAEHLLSQPAVTEWGAHQRTQCVDCMCVRVCACAKGPRYHQPMQSMHWVPATVAVWRL